MTLPLDADTKANPATEDINITIPEDFGKIIIDMTQDILNSFPEQRINISDDLKTMLLNVNDKGNDSDEYNSAYKNVYDEAIKSVFIFSKQKYPPLFFDILYQNAAMFDRETSELELLPGLNFKLIWNDNISDNTRETIWKYLQLVLFNVVSSVTEASNNAFGSSNVFESLSSDEFKSKISDTVDKMKHFFETVQSSTQNTGAQEMPTADKGDKPRENINIDDFANPEHLHEHINKIMGGKLGNIAKEIAEESVEDFKANIGNPETVGDVFKNLMKNPAKLMGLIKNVGEKLDSKMKSGLMKESDMLAEASEMLKNMKNVPGMGDIHELMRGMGGMGGMGGANASASSSSGNINTAATNNRITQRLRAVKIQERMLDKLEKKRANNGK